MMAIGKTFGQHEPLTTRLNNLVRSYPKGLGILKEFIQNADDAEADEIQFIIDERHYDVEEMPACMQWLHATPALIIYNNKPFSDLDIEGIQNIGESGKSASVGKIGRFGLGFNACYNVTDVPSFYTRESLHFFDPHLKTVPAASNESPGRYFTTSELENEGWPLLDSFKSILCDEAALNGTIFRLPFRSKQQASNSLIKKEPYTISDALEAVNELKEMGSSMLLFLKHVRKLKVLHLKQDDSTSVLLDIHAANPEKINSSKDEVNLLLKSLEPDEVLKSLSAQGSLYSFCCHEYHVLTNGEERKEAWFVVDGFFVDEDQEVLNVCRKMIEIDEKALPYAGAAWPLDIERPPPGKIFCFLPVPIQTNIPIQVNGYFDLDDSRQNMFLDQSSHGSARLRVEWNKTLLETSVTQAYVQLLEELRPFLKSEDLRSYYSAFPSSSASKTNWEGWLTAAFYENALSAPLIRVSEKNSWRILSETRSLPPELLSVSEALISERFLPIPQPSLPRRVIKGFSSINFEVPLLSPNELRTQLTEEKDINCPLTSAPRKCLQERDAVINIFRFCLSDSPGDNIRGLPLVIDYRGYLRTLGFTAYPLYLADQLYDIDVFFDHPEWFVDPKIARDLGLEEAKGAALLDMNSERFVFELAKYVSVQSVDDEAKMNGAKAGALTDAWLQAVFSRLMVSELDGHEDDVNEIPLVPDQSRTLRKMGDNSTPLLFRGAPSLKRALTELSLPLVTNASAELVKLLQRFTEKVNCIWTVTPRDLIDTLTEECNETLQEYDHLTEVQRALLDYFSKDECLEELKTLPDRRNNLKSLLLFPTSKGTLANLNEPAYVSEDFSFPSVDFDVVLLDDGPSHRWRELYLLLDVPKLSRPRLIRELILPGFEVLDDLSRLETSMWLRDNLSVAQSEDEDTGCEDLLGEVLEAPIIVCTNGKLLPPKSVYQPESKLAKSVLGDQAAFPDMVETYEQHSDRWIEFFRQLNMPVEPRLDDVVSYVHSLVDETPSDENTDRLKAVYLFIKGRVDEDIQEQNALSSELSDAVDELADIDWIPLRQEAGNLLCFSPPEETYARPAEVYFPRVGQLVASQACVTVLSPEPNKRVRTAMGFPLKPPAVLVVEHFHKLLLFFSSDENTPRESDKVKALAAIYRFFGGEVPDEADELDEDLEGQDNDGKVDLETMFSETPCIWDLGLKRFWRPDHVFSENVGYMEPWRRTITVSGEAIERGYAALGRRVSPTIEDWKQVLVEISESGEAPSKYEVSRIIREVIWKTVTYLKGEDSIDGDVLVPTQNGMMLAAKTVFMADAPWYESMLSSWDIHILSPSVSGIWGIQSVLGIPSLASSINERLNEYPIESDIEEHCIECSRLETLLRSDEFIYSLRRLLRNEGNEVEEYSLSYLRDSHVTCVQIIQTSLSLQTDGVEQLLGDSETGSYWDSEDNHAMLAENRHRYFCDDLADLINRTLGHYSLQNLVPLGYLLRCKAGEMSGVLDDLKIRKYSFDLEEERAHEKDVAPQDFPNESETDEFEDESETDEHEDESETDELEDESETDKLDDESKTDQSQQHTISHVTSTATRARRPDSEQTKTVSGGTGRHTGTGTSSSSPKRTDVETGAPTRSRKSTSSSSQTSSQRRLVSYVSQANHDENRESETASAENRRIRIGDAAVKIVIEHEKKSGREARSMAHDNPGYDVISEGCGDTRYIEVKGTEAAWGERGVAVTPTQFFYARENPEREHWLYVVEDVFSQSSKVHEIHNPSELVDRFVFDGGWKQAAESAEATGVKLHLPAPGDEVLLDGVVVGIVESTREFGRFPLVIYKDKNGNQHKKRLADVIIHTKDS